MELDINIEYKIREVRKLLDILKRYGNVLANGIPAATRLTEVVDELKLNGFSMDNISIRVDQLDKQK